MKSTPKAIHFVVVGLAALVLAACGTAATVDTQKSAHDDAASRAALAAVTYIQPCEGDPVQKPTGLSQACDDSSDAIYHLRWKHWGDERAEATGVIDHLDANDKTVSYQVKVVASDLERGEASARYRTLTITPTGNAPAEAVEKLVWQLQ